MQLSKEEFNQQYYTKEWHEIRLRILKRDSFKCQRCGSKKQLQVHHIHYLNGVLDVPDIFLITLCRDCHRKQHGLEKPRKKKKQKQREKFPGYKIRGKRVVYKGKTIGKLRKGE